MTTADYWIETHCQRKLVLPCFRCLGILEWNAEENNSHECPTNPSTNSVLTDTYRHNGNQNIISTPTS